MTPQEIQALVQAEVARAITQHAHTGLDSPIIDSRDLYVVVTTTIPTDAAAEGSRRIYVNSLTAPTVWRLYIRAGKTWKYKTFDNT